MVRSKSRRGRLSVEDWEYIRANFKSKSINDIAKHLNKTTSAVKSYIYQQKLLSSDELDNANLRRELKNNLKKRPYWAELQRQLNKSELIYFSEMWTDFMQQFQEDVLASEELQIKQWIVLDILVNRCMEQRKKHIEDIERLEQALSDEYKKDEGIRDREAIEHLRTQLGFARAAVSAFSVEHDKLSNHMEKTLKDLKATRADRIKKIEDSGTTFLSIIRMLEDETKRKFEGDMAGMIKVAVDKEYKRLGGYHEYVDGEVDRPILNSETVMTEENDDI